MAKAQIDLMAVGGSGLDTIDFTQFALLARNQSISGNTVGTFNGLTSKPKMIVVTKLYNGAGVIVYNVENDTQFYWETANNQQSQQYITEITDSYIKIRNGNSTSVSLDIYVMY